VKVVGCEEIEDSGNESAKLEFAGYVIGIENEFPKGIRPNIVGGFVVFPLSDDVDVEVSSASLSPSPVCRLNKSLPVNKFRGGKIDLSRGGSNVWA
jgi:hypothetical protein